MAEPRAGGSGVWGVERCAETEVPRAASGENQTVDRRWRGARGWGEARAGSAQADPTPDSRRTAHG